jgi:hypothetical protein
LRILVLAGAASDLGPRATVLGLARALRAAQPEARLTTTLADAAGEDSDVAAGRCARLAAARKADVVLATTDAVSELRVADAAALWAMGRARPIDGVAIARCDQTGWAARRLRAHALARMRTVTAADRASAADIAAARAAPTGVLPDPALLVPAAFEDRARAALAAAGAPCDGTPLIGVTPQASARDPETASLRRVELLARVADEAIARHDAFVVYLPARASDAALCAAIAAAQSSDRACVAPPFDPATFKGVASMLMLLLSSHRRAGLLAASVGRPVICLGAPGVLAGALADAGAGHEFLDDALFVRGGLTAQLGEMIDAAAEVRRTSLVRIEELKAAVREGARRLLDERSG